MEGRVTYTHGHPRFILYGNSIKACRLFALLYKRELAPKSHCPCHVAVVLAFGYKPSNAERPSPLAEHTHIVLGVG